MSWLGNTMVHTLMRDKQYKPYCYRLNEKTNEEIKKLADENGLSKNILFLNFINLAKKYGVQELRKATKKKTTQISKTKDA